MIRSFQAMIWSFQGMIRLFQATLIYKQGDLTRCFGMLKYSNNKFFFFIVRIKIRNFAAYYIYYLRTYS